MLEVPRSAFLIGRESGVVETSNTFFLKNIKNKYKDDLVRSSVAFRIVLLSFYLAFHTLEFVILCAKDFTKIEYMVMCSF